MDVVSQEEFEQAMYALGMYKVCAICDGPVEDSYELKPRHYGSPCRGYGTGTAYNWKMRAEGE